MGGDYLYFNLEVKDYWVKLGRKEDINISYILDGENMIWWLKW